MSSFLFESPVKTPKDLPSMKYFPIFDQRWKNTSKADDGKVKKAKARKADSERKAVTTPNTVNKSQSSSSSASKRTRPSPSRKKLFSSNEQYFLDFGQKDFEAHKCAVCGMMYNRGELGEERTHDNYHDKFVNSIKVHDWKYAQLVAQFPDGHVLRVVATSPAYMLRKVNELFEVADMELGIHQDMRSSMSPTTVVLIFVSQHKRIAGFVAAERIVAANRLISDQSTLMASTEDEPAEIGVARVWTHPNYRRQRIATRMLDILLVQFQPDKAAVAREALAFSDPTLLGNNFAKNYFGTEHFLIYMHRHQADFVPAEGNGQQPRRHPSSALD